jgi:hypothetical protein
MEVDKKMSDRATTVDDTVDVDGSPAGSMSGIVPLKADPSTLPSNSEHMIIERFTKRGCSVAKPIVLGDSGAEDVRSLRGAGRKVAGRTIGFRP